MHLQKSSSNGRIQFRYLVLFCAIAVACLHLYLATILTNRAGLAGSSTDHAGSGATGGIGENLKINDEGGTNAAFSEVDASFHSIHTQTRIRNEFENVHQGRGENDSLPVVHADAPRATIAYGTNILKYNSCYDNVSRGCSIHLTHGLYFRFFQSTKRPTNQSYFTHQLQCRLD